MSEKDEKTEDQLHEQNSADANRRTETLARFRLDFLGILNTFFFSHSSISYHSSPSHCSFSSSAGCSLLPLYQIHHHVITAASFIVDPINSPNGYSKGKS